MKNQLKTVIQPLGLLAAELRVKKAVIPLSFRQRKTSGKGLRFIFQKARIGLATRATMSMQPTIMQSNWP